MRSAEPLVVGVDGGGTSTRCLVATFSGEIVGRGRAGGANPRSARDPGGNLARALTEALSQIGPRFGPGDVAGGVFGLAGASEAGRRQADAISQDAWHGAGLPGRPVIVPDILVAFAGATPAPSGNVIIAGTGAVAAHVEDRRMVRRCDGYGWLLGDEGSGVWIGRRAVQAALAAIDGRGRPTLLTSLIVPTLREPLPASGVTAHADAATARPAVPGAPASTGEASPATTPTSEASPAPAPIGGSSPAPAQTGGSSPALGADAPQADALQADGLHTDGLHTDAIQADDLRADAIQADALRREALTQAIIAVVYDGEPARLGRLSPVVEAAAREGDHVALAIVDDAARRLVATLAAVGEGDPGLPVVLAGSLLTHPTLVAERVRRSLLGRPVVLARDGAAGAAALALRAALPAGATAQAEAAHRRLLAA
ncbi:BadF/BadG/BcrA/BcrD ATPase family protein [Sphaerisporangium sp. NPDC005289]|uniref:N-acetylglucosamine kinase n=1 Tax=Sphaerisporangium sp. NPDC005289 TaxID=3155247 RepID=UPI0033A34F98